MKVAVIQKPPVLLNREATVARMIELIEEAFSSFPKLMCPAIRPGSGG